MNVIAVIGAGGQTGIICVDELVKSGYKVKALVRNPEKYQDKFSQKQNVELVQADITQYSQLKEALRQCSGVIIAAGAPNGKMTKSVDYLGVEATAQICQKLGIKKLVLISSILVTPKNWLHPIRILLDTYLWNTLAFKWQGEEAIRKSGVASYTIVRPGGLLNSSPGQQKLITCQGDNQYLTCMLMTVSRGDVAKICVEAIQNEDSHNKTFEISSDFWDIFQQQKPSPDQIKQIFKNLKTNYYN